MKRRAFLKTSIAASALAGLAGISTRTQAAEPKAKGKGQGGGREFYDFRAYRMKPGGDPAPLHEFLKKAAIPALTKFGAGPIGVFTETEQKDPATVFVLIPYPGLQAFLQGTQWLQQDASAVKLTPGYLEAPKDKPGFDRIDIWLLRAFEGMPKVELPAYSKEKRERMFELRTYESHSELKAARKVAMFNDGEIDVMRETGLAPVFYGEALTGPNLPHLTYMTSAENAEAHKSHWDAFGKHPKWDQMKNDPKYADTVSKITKWFLKPTDYSQI